MNRELNFHTDPRPKERTGFSLRTWFWILASSACYYATTRIAWALCLPDSKVCLFFPPHAVLVSVLLLVPTRHWWAYTLGAVCGHFIATQQAGWPPLYAFHCEVFDAAQNLLVAGGIRHFIKSPFVSFTLRDAAVFVLIAVVIVPFGTAFWGAAFTISNHFGTHYWIEWRNLGVSNAVTALVLVPAILLSTHYIRTRRLKITPARLVEAIILGAGLLLAAEFAFDRETAGPAAAPTLLYASIPFLLWAAVRFGFGGVSLSMVLITFFAIWGTMHGRGPFLEQAPAENVLALQLFLLVMAAPLMLLAIVIENEKRSKQALLHSEERMSLAAEGARLSMWEWDIARDEVWMSVEGRELFGFGPETPVNFALVAQRVHPEDRAARETIMRDAVSLGTSYQTEFRLLLPDGSTRWIASRGRCARGGDGLGPRLLGISLDITSQKQADADAQQRRDELAHLSRVAALSALSGSLAHELNQPLASILSNAQAAQRIFAQQPPDLDEIRAILGDIVSEDRRAAEVIHGLRALLRRGNAALQPVDVNESLEELLRLTRGDLEERGVAVSCQLAADLPAAMTDRVQLQQVLLNLIMNARDAMEGIPPEDRRLALATFREQDEVRIRVHDCGMGLPADMEVIFEPFHTTKPGGLGMGLSICRTLVTAHGGRLWAERNPGRGATFHVALTVAAESGK